MIFEAGWQTFEIFVSCACLMRGKSCERQLDELCMGKLLSSMAVNRTSEWFAERADSERSPEQTTIANDIRKLMFVT